MGAEIMSDCVLAVVDAAKAVIGKADKTASAIVMQHELNLLRDTLTKLEIKPDRSKDQVDKSDWITDRVPTLEDADNVGDVWVTVSTKLRTQPFDQITAGTPWMPKQPTPKPYVPPKPKRFKAWVNDVVDSDGVEHQWHHTKTLCEVLYGDPDPDIVLEVLAEIKEASEADGRRLVIPNIVAKSWFNRIEQSRRELWKSMKRAS